MEARTTEHTTIEWKATFIKLFLLVASVLLGVVFIAQRGTFSSGEAVIIQAVALALGIAVGVSRPRLTSK